MGAVIICIRLNHNPNNLLPWVASCHIFAHRMRKVANTAATHPLIYHSYPPIRVSISLSMNYSLLSSVYPNATIHPVIHPSIHQETQLSSIHLSIHLPPHPSTHPIHQSLQPMQQSLHAAFVANCPYLSTSSTPTLKLSLCSPTAVPASQAPSNC